MSTLRFQEPPSSLPSVFVTSGGTRINIDDVRHIGNMSGGSLGCSVALNMMELRSEWQLHYLYARDSKCPERMEWDVSGSVTEQLETMLARRRIVCAGGNGMKAKYYPTSFVDFNDYADQVRHISKTFKPSITILAAAVSDYGLEKQKGKISSKDDCLSIELTKLPKIISKIKRWNPKTFLVGFKLLVGSTPTIRYDAAKKQMEESGSDVVIVNDLKQIKENRHILYVYSNPCKDLMISVGETQCYRDDQHLDRKLFPTAGDAVMRRVLDAYAERLKFLKE